MAGRAIVPVHERGWLDTRDRLQRIFAADRALTQLFSRNADLGVLADERATVISAAMTIAVSARYAIIGGHLPTTEYIQSVVIGELMSPMLPVASSLPAAEANAVFGHILDYIVANELSICRGNTVNRWLEEVNAARAEDLPPLVAITTFDEKVRYLLWLACALRPSAYYDALTLVVTSFISVAKRGTVSERFLEKIQNGIAMELNRELQLSADVISYTYQNFGRHVDDTNAEQVFERWLADIPQHALRVRLTLQQTSGSGLTAFLIVGRAMKMYPDFQWARCNQLTGMELTRYRDAVVAVGGNKYYGFRHDLGPAKSTNFSSLAYVSKELLLRLNGETSLKNYQGWVKQPKSAAVIKEMIDNYVTAKAEELTNAGAPPADNILWDELRGVLGNEANADMFA